MGSMITLWTHDKEGSLPVMSREEVRALDAWAIERMGIPGVVLMENAGLSCAEVVWGFLQASAAPSVTIFCGTGNNGGDGFVIARHLVNVGIDVRILLCGAREKLHGDALTNFRVAEAMGIAVRAADPASEVFATAARSACEGAEWVVDAYLGTGLKGELSEAARRVIEAVNASGKPVLAVDIPSGMDCDRGVGLPVCVQAKVTVTLAALKRGFVENPDARQATGAVYVASIGIGAGFYRA